VEVSESGDNYIFASQRCKQLFGRIVSVSLIEFFLMNRILVFRIIHSYIRLVIDSWSRLEKQRLARMHSSKMGGA